MASEGDGRGKYEVYVPTWKLTFVLIFLLMVRNIQSLIQLETNNNESILTLRATTRMDLN